MSSGTGGPRSTRRLCQLLSHLSNNSSPSVSPSTLSNNSSPGTRRTTRFLCSSSNTGKPNDKPLQSTRNGSIEIPHSERVDNVPNESWSKETLDIHNKLQNLVDNSSGAWLKHHPKKNSPGNRLFVHCVDEKGKLLEYFMIYNKSEQHIKGMCQFGPYTEGPNWFVHGGAIATMLDIVTSALPIVCGYVQTLTANLYIDFKKPIPIGSTVVLESKIKSIEGRKFFIDGEIKTPDGLLIYATAKTLCVLVNHKS